MKQQNIQAALRRSDLRVTGRLSKATRRGRRLNLNVWSIFVISIGVRIPNRMYSRALTEVNCMSLAFFYKKFPASDGESFEYMGFTGF